MRIRPSNSRHKGEQGIIITLIAIFMLFVVGAMAALSIDVVTFYTARSEAQIAADSAALAAARVLANSGMTSSSGGTFPVDLATIVATQVAQQNLIGGNPPQITVTFGNINASQALNNPRVTVKVTRSDLPTFFARIWGTKTVSVSASATAETYNPSGLASNGSNGGDALPVASSCVKPWLLPNIDPSPTANANGYIFDPASGAIQDPGLLGFTSPTPVADKTSLHSACGGDCSGGLSSPSPWQYFPADFSQGNIIQATTASVSCLGGSRFTQYQLNVAGCVQTPIACGPNNANIVDNLYIDTTTDYSGANRDLDTAFAVDNCLTHTAGARGSGVPPPPGDSVAPNNSPPFQFLAGTQNPMVPTSLAGSDILTSDSLVTVPVFDSRNLANPVQVIGFVQLFLEPTGYHVDFTNMIPTTVTNMVGCGTNASGTPVYGNGPSAVPVRLISNSPAN